MTLVIFAYTEMKLFLQGAINTSLYSNAISWNLRGFYIEAESIICMGVIFSCSGFEEKWK